MNNPIHYIMWDEITDPFSNWWLHGLSTVPKRLLNLITLAHFFFFFLVAKDRPICWHWHCFTPIVPINNHIEGKLQATTACALLGWINKMMSQWHFLVTSTDTNHNIDLKVRRRSHLPWGSRVSMFCRTQLHSLTFPNFNGATFEVWEWISNFIPHFTVPVITYPCWDWS